MAAITLAYTSKELQPPASLQVHSMRGMSALWALVDGLPIEETCLVLTDEMSLPRHWQALLQASMLEAHLGCFHTKGPSVNVPLQFFFTVL